MRNLMEDAIYLYHRSWSREIKLVLSWKLHPIFLEIIVLEVPKYSTRGGKESSVSPAKKPVSYNLKILTCLQSMTGTISTMLKLKSTTRVRDEYFSFGSKFMNYAFWIIQCLDVEEKQKAKL